ncbi:hypothetical protein GE09DRAFT_1294599 [Coniochaeta sp. 2T2.1]|nr:hypothetical protein GE09DRAFT_1294599 [Coniochaeta sp. 2T2.1]
MATVNQDDPTTGQNPKHVGTRILNGMPTPSPEPPTESDKQADVMRNEILGTESSPEPQPKDHAIPSVEGNNKNNDAKTPGDDNDDGDGASDDTSDSEDEKKPQSEEAFDSDKEPLGKLARIKEALDELVRKHYYPETWSIPADFAGTAKVEAEYRKKTRDEAAKLVETATQKAAAEAAKVAEQAKNVDTGAKGAPRNGEVAPTARITYPWPTRKMDDGTLILGLRRRGKIGHQVCVEVEDNGRITRMLKTGSEVGLLDVQLYKGDSEDDWKNLGKVRDPNADCCVKFKKGGIQMGCVSKFVKLLGPTSAKQMIEKVCRRDGVAPPWEAEIVTQSNDPRTERRRTRQSRIDKAVKTSAPQEAEVTEDPAVESSAPQDADGPEDLRNKVGKLETDMGDISTMVASLLDLVKRLSSNTAGS